MDQKWFDIQAEALGAVLAEQGLGLPVPTVLSATYAAPPVDSLAAFIDHTLLKPQAGAKEFEQLVKDAREYGFASVCVNPAYVKSVRGMLGDSPVKVCTTIGFPLGANTTTVKVMEVRDALANGAEEFDMVLAVGLFKDQDYAGVYEDISSVVRAAAGCVVKVILETGLLTKEEIARACLLTKMAGAHFVKTATGFSGGGAAVEDIELMRRIVGSEFGVKASGGIRDRAAAEAMIHAGANRIGTSSGVAIVSGSQGGSDY